MSYIVFDLFIFVVLIIIVLGPRYKRKQKKIYIYIYMVRPPRALPFAYLLSWDDEFCCFGKSWRIMKEDDGRKTER